MKMTHSVVSAVIALGIGGVACGSTGAREGTGVAESTEQAPLELVSTRVVAEPVNWPESPLYSGNQLFYVAYGSNQVFRSDGGAPSVFWHEDGCGPSAILRLPNGEFLVTCYDNNTLAHLSSTGATLAPISKDDSGAAFKGPNDFALDAKGGVYFSASGVFDPTAPVEGKVYYRSPDGRSIREVASNIHYSNGLVVAKDGHHLLVAEHLEAQVLSFAIDASGGLSNRAVFVRMKDVVPTPANAPWSYGCDGVKRDRDGNIFIANYAGQRLVVTDAHGKFLATVAAPAGYPFVDNVGFGPDLFAHEWKSDRCDDGEKFLYVSALKDDSKDPYPGAIFRVKNPIR